MLKQVDISQQQIDISTIVSLDYLVYVYIAYVYSPQR